MKSQEALKAKYDRALARRVDHRIRLIERQIDFLIGQADTEDDPQRVSFIHMRLRHIERRLQSALGESSPQLVHADDLKNLPGAQDDRSDSH